MPPKAIPPGLAAAAAALAGDESNTDDSLFSLFNSPRAPRATPSAGTASPAPEDTTDLVEVLFDFPLDPTNTEDQNMKIIDGEFTENYQYRVIRKFSDEGQYMLYFDNATAGRLMSKLGKEGRHPFRDTDIPFRFTDNGLETLVRLANQIQAGGGNTGVPGTINSTTSTVPAPVAKPPTPKPTGKEPIPQKPKDPKPTGGKSPTPAIPAPAPIPTPTITTATPTENTPATTEQPKQPTRMTTRSGAKGGKTTATGATAPKTTGTKDTAKTGTDTKSNGTKSGGTKSGGTKSGGTKSGGTKSGGTKSTPPDPKAPTTPQTEDEKKKQQLDHEVKLEVAARAHALKNKHIEQSRLADPKYKNKELADQVIAQEKAKEEANNNKPEKDESVREIPLTMEREEDINGDEEVQIRVRKNGPFNKLYLDLYGRNLAIHHHYPESGPFHTGGDVTLPKDNKQPLSKSALMICSGYAEQYFSHYSWENVLPLPVQHPDQNPGWETGQTLFRDNFNNYAGHIRHREIERYLLPWFRDMETELRKKKPKEYKMENYPQIEIPKRLEEKIYLYTAMLHLAIPLYFQQPLIQELCVNIYENRLENCHLELLEFTVGRFHARTVAVLDPVLCCLVGSYAHRDKNDRAGVAVAQKDVSDDNDTGPFQIGKKLKANNGKAIPTSENREVENVQKLDYHYKRIMRNVGGPGERRYPDEQLMPAPLPVLGHAIRNWSRGGVSPPDPPEEDVRSGIHIGYPLDIGAKKYYKRNHETMEGGQTDAQTEGNIPTTLDVVPETGIDLLERVKHLISPPGHPAEHGARDPRHPCNCP